VPAPPHVSGDTQLLGQVPPQPSLPPHTPVQLGVQQPLSANVQLLSPPGELHRYVLLSEPQAVPPLAAETGTSPGPVPSQLQMPAMSVVPPSVAPQPAAENVQLSSPPGELHRYVLLSEPHAVLPQSTVTGTSPGPVPSQLQLGTW
jgi:hypothetical protein